jgi:hypothetical protein
LASEEETVESIMSRLGTRRAQRWLLWLSGLVLAAGIAAVLVVFLRNTGTSVQAPFSNKPVDVVKTPKKAPLSKDARLVAGRFVLTAVQRKNLAEAWKLVGPAIRQGLTYKQWLTGNIPVVPFTDEISLAPMKVDFSSKSYALLEVILLPKNAKVKSEIFTLEMIKVGKGKNRHWVVNSWAPRSHPAIPNNPGG